jgi:hypothetical protein
MIPDERAESALRYLAETDESCAAAKMDMERFEWKAKATRQQIFMHVTGTVAERNAKAETHADVSTAMDSYFLAVAAYSKMANKRETARITLDVWRSLQANRRSGHP